MKMRDFLLRRNVVCILLFLGFFNIYAMRVNLSIAVVAMTRTYKTVMENGTVIQTVDFDWDSKQKGYVLGSFFYGYVMSQLAGGWLSSKYGGVRVFGIGVFLSALLTIATPIAANISIYGIILARAIEGLFEGISYPCSHAIWSNWAPPEERTRLAAIAFSGTNFGIIISLPLYGLMAEYWGWPSVFYIPGIIGIVWCILWFTVVKDNPENDPKITTEELKYLTDTLGKTTNVTKRLVAGFNSYGFLPGDRYSNRTYPWKKILSSMPVWAIVFAHFAEYWGFFTIFTTLPMFLNDIWNFDVTETGLLSTIPYIAQSFGPIFIGIFADYLRKNKILSTTMVRKVFNSISCFSQATFIMLLAYSDSPWMAIAFLTVSVGAGSFSFASVFVNHLDIAPQYASVLFGASSTIACISGAVAPSVAGYITTTKSKYEWRLVFLISTIIYIVGGIFYIFFASGDVQLWAMTEEEKKTQDECDKKIDNKEKQNTLC